MYMLCNRNCIKCHFIVDRFIPCFTQLLSLARGHFTNFLCISLSSFLDLASQRGWGWVALERMVGHIFMKLHMHFSCSALEIHVSAHNGVLFSWAIQMESEILLPVFTRVAIYSCSVFYGVLGNLFSVNLLPVLSGQIYDSHANYIVYRPENQINQLTTKKPQFEF